MKLHKYNSRQLVYYYGKEQAVEIPEYKHNEEGVRGVWVSNVVNIDTPIMKDTESYQTYLKDMIANIASYNMNLIIFQVRPCNDAYYPSKLNPWSRFITGVEGKDPGFDVLKFVIDEAKKYNIEVHAWMNPYRVTQKPLDQTGMTKEEMLDTLAENNYARVHKEDTILDGKNNIILKPASPTVIKFVTDTVMEVIENYDVTGVHIDDYFYPYAKVPRELEEEDYQAALQENKDLTFEDWRRSNVDKMISSIHYAMKKSLGNSGRKVEFGISPFGIYRTNIALKENGWEKGSFHSAGALECYQDLYSDVYKWMQEGWIDYVVPQLYFPFERKDVNYHDLTKWWSERCLETNTKLYIGQAIYQMGANPTWGNPLEIDYQIRLNQVYPNILGTILFTYHDLVPGRNPIKDASISLLKVRWNSQKIQKKFEEELKK